MIQVFCTVFKSNLTNRDEKVCNNMEIVIPDPLVRVFVLPNQRKIICPGLEIKGLQPTIIPRRGQRGNRAYEKFTFCPFIENSSESLEAQLSEMVDLVLENNQSKDLKVMDIFTQKENSLAKMFQRILNLKPLREVSRCSI